MFRRQITNGDLMVVYKPWYSLSYTPYRNLSEEVRVLGELTEGAKSKYMELSNRYTIASTNIADELETLQLHLLDNSDAYYETPVDNSILEKREGLKYKFKRDGDKKKDSSSNKDKQKKKKDKGSKAVSLLDVLLKSKYTLH